MKHGWCEQVGEVKLTRAQYGEYRRLWPGYGDMERYCLEIYRRRLADAAMAERDAATIRREQRQWLWRQVGIGAAVTAAVVLVCWEEGLGNVIGFLGAMGIFYWVWRFFKGVFF